MMTFILSLVFPINDITTTLEDPPSFQGQEIEVFDPKLKERHQRLYPNLKPVELQASPQEVYSKLKDWIEGRDDWEMNHQEEPRQLEWVATTELMNFKDDVVVRLEELGEKQTKVHLRSKSRVGKSDLTANAKRIEEVLSFLIKNTRATKDS